MTTTEEAGTPRVVSTEARFWQAANVAALLLAALVPLYIATFAPNPIRETRLEGGLSITSNVTSSLSDLGERAQVSIAIDDQPVKNLVLSIVDIKNTGSTPIVPTDFFEKLAVNVNKDWKILLVKNIDGSNMPAWAKVNDQKFEATPTLLNPGDEIKIDLYATNIQVDKPSFAEVSALKPTWSAHILNLKSIAQQQNPFLNASRDPLVGIVPFIVLLQGSGLAATLSGAVFFTAIYLHLLFRLNVIGAGRLRAMLAIVGVAALSLTSSEAMATYLFPNILNRISGIDPWLNMPWIILNFIVLVVLSWKVRTTAGG